MSDLFFRKTAYATEQVTVSNSAIQPTASLRANTAGAETDGSSPARWAVTFPANALVVELIGDNGICYTLDGSVPSTTNGGRLATAGDTIIVLGQHKVNNLRMIRTGGSDATVNITFYRD